MKRPRSRYGKGVRPGKDARKSMDLRQRKIVTSPLPPPPDTGKLVGTGQDGVHQERHPADQFFGKGKPVWESDFANVSPEMEIVANRILGGGGHPPPALKKGEEPSLADRFIAATYMGGTKLTGRIRRNVQEAMDRYRLDMRHAHRFVLTNEFTEMATIAATVPAEKTLARIQYATLPYEHTWIEFDLHAKMRVLQQMYGTQVKFAGIAQHMGMLIQRISETEAVVTCVTSDDDDYVAPHLACYFFSTDETNWLTRNRTYHGCAPTNFHLSKLSDLTEEEVGRIVAAGEDNGAATLWGYTKAEGNATTDGPIMVRSIQNLINPEFLRRHGAAGRSRLCRAYADIEEEGRVPVKVADILSMELREFTGTMRWLVTVLAMLNEVPVYVDRVERPSHQMKVGHFKKHTFVDYHRVTLRLPKKDPVKWIERHLRDGPERRHRAHEVRSFWRTYLNEVHCRYDEHSWEYDHDAGYRLCGKCMAYGRLIKEHIRGNAELGWVRKDYVIKPS